MTSTTEPTRQTSRAVTYSWLVLTALTVLTWWLAPGHSAAPATASIPITLAVVAVGFIKSRLIIRYFMEVHTAPRWLKIVTDLWLLILGSAVLAIYLLV